MSRVRHGERVEELVLGLQIRRLLCKSGVETDHEPVLRLVDLGGMIKTRHYISKSV